MEESRATQAAAALAHTVMSPSGYRGKGQRKAVTGVRITSALIFRPQHFVTYWVGELAVQQAGMLSFKKDVLNLTLNLININAVYSCLA